MKDTTKHTEDAKVNPEQILTSKDSDLGTIPPWLDRMEAALVRVLRVLLVLSAIAVLVAGTLMIVNMNASECSQGGAVYVGIAMVVLLGVILGRLKLLGTRKSR